MQMATLQIVAAAAAASGHEQLRQHGLRLCVAIQRHQCFGQRLAHQAIVGLQLERPAEGGEGIGRPAHAQQQLADVDKNRGIARIELGGALIGRERVGTATGRRQGQSAASMCGCQAGIQPQRVLEGVHPGRDVAGKDSRPSKGHPCRPVPGFCGRRGPDHAGLPAPFGLPPPWQ